MGAMGQAGGGPGDTGGTPCSSCGVSCRWHSSLRASCPKELCAKGFSSRGQTAAKGFYVGNELLEAGGAVGLDRMLQEPHLQQHGATLKLGCTWLQPQCWQCPEPSTSAPLRRSVKERKKHLERQQSTASRSSVAVVDVPTVLPAWRGRAVPAVSAAGCPAVHPIEQDGAPQGAQTAGWGAQRGNSVVCK